MKTFLLTISSLLCFLMLTAQHNEEYLLLEADSLWSKETFDIPTRFAPEMTLEGFEDARFPPEWGKPDSDAFWSYVFAWSISEENQIPIKDLEHNLTSYFDGLMNIPKDTIIALKLPTTTLLVEKSRTKDKIVYYGKIRTFDNFSAQKMMTLYLLAEQYLCASTKRNIIVFRFSPKAFDHSIWQKLNTISLLKGVCAPE